MLEDKLFNEEIAKLDEYFTTIKEDLIRLNEPALAVGDSVARFRDEVRAAWLSQSISKISGLLGVILLKMIKADNGSNSGNPTDRKESHARQEDHDTPER